MSTVHNESLVRSFVKSVSSYIPQVEKPKKKIGLSEKFIWCGIALFAYLVMGQIPLYGVTDSPKFDFLAFARVIFAAQQGTLLELGIGPIVTAGLLMQLLKGSELIKLNFKDPDDRSLFTSATKIVTIIVIVAEGSLYGVSVYGHLLASPSFIPILVAQLVGSSLIVMYLDETIQKGWGLGSGISLFIMAGVAQGIMWSIFSPIPAQDGPVGVIPYIIHSAAQGDMSNVLFRTGQLPSIFGLIVTSLVLLALVYGRSIGDLLLYIL
jgi:protein transport protein SEC61 subunit alpha